MKNFTAKQKEIIARKLGYDGPMQGFDEFVQSSPALAMKYEMINDKYTERMNKGGAVMRYQEGGSVEQLRSTFDTSIFSKTPQEKATYYNSLLDTGYDDETIRAAIGAPLDQNWSALTSMASQQRAAAPAPSPTPAPAPSSSLDNMDMAVVVYGPDGTQYGSPNAARAAGVTNYTTTPPSTKPKATREQVLAAYRNNPLAELSPGEEAIDYWMRTGLDSFDQVVRDVRAANPQLAASIDAARKATTTQSPVQKLRASFDQSIFSKTPTEKAAYYNSLLAAGYDDATIREAINAPLDANWAELQRIAAGLRTKAPAPSPSPSPSPSPAPAPASTSRLSAADVTNLISTTEAGTNPATQYSETGKPLMGAAKTVTAEQTAITGDMKLDASKYAAATQAPEAKQTLAVGAADVTKPTAVAGQTVTAATAKPAVEQAMLGVVPATGTAQTIQAAQLTEQQKQAGMAQAQQLDKAQQAQLATRTLQEGELVSGTAVDMRRAEEAIAKTQAAQGVVTEDMTVQGQLTKLTANFDASNPPPWAAGAIRSVTAQLAARGLSASSMAGQAIVQAALEMATPIASADAAAYQQMAAQNLSNRQQVAILSAQQRAQFLGQEFDQTFQTRVLNAAKIADIANMNFTAQQQVYLENARLAQSVDLANLNNRQATTIANAATLASMEMANLNARQQTAVANAQNFLQMEMANMSNTQQAALFKAQTLAQAALSDTAAENTARQFNATNKQQADQFNASLSTQVAQFNTAQYNAIQQFNAGQANAVSQFNAQMQGQRQEFNARNRIIIDQANAQLIAQISTANTAATNAANFQNAQAMNNMTLAQYNNEVQLYRDQVKMVFDSYERAEDRAASMATAVLQAEIAREKISAESSAALGKLFGSVIGTKAGEKILDTGLEFIKNLFGP